VVVSRKSRKNGDPRSKSGKAQPKQNKK
jgi:hypothetical protein